MITLYLDMDGVLADFAKAYVDFEPLDKNTRKFKAAVKEAKIFEHLDMMPDTHELLNHVRHLEDHGDINIEILTSMGTYEPFFANEVKNQKGTWLRKHNILYKRNFVHNKREKANYADSCSILIDDSVGCVSPFMEHGGHGILHTNASNSIRLLDSTILQIRANKSSVPFPQTNSQVDCK